MLNTRPLRPPTPAGRSSVHFSLSTSAPIGGLNVRDSINNMPQNDALLLKNWIAQEYGVRCRKGYMEWATDADDQIQTVMTYQPDRANVAGFKVFAATDTAIYDVTVSTNAPTVSEPLSGGSNVGRFSNTMFNNVAGRFLLACSHEGGYKIYDGTTWATPTLGGGAGQVTPVDPGLLCFVTSFKHLNWFVEKGSSDVWYSAPDAITGTLTKFPLGPFLRNGGSIAFIATWTIDAGEGIDDLIVFVSEMGDVIIYKGINPATDFEQVGRWYVGRIPVGRRCFCRLGGDLLILSEMGLQPLSFVTRGGQQQYRTSATDYLSKIQPALTQLVSQLGDQLGFELVLHPKENLLLVLKPLGGVILYQQFALYTNNLTWTILEGIPIYTACVANNEMYGGTLDGRVLLTLHGFFDNVLLGEDVGDGIPGIIEPAFSYFGRPGKFKQLHMVRPIFQATDRPSVVVAGLADFEGYLSFGTPISFPLEGAMWDVAIWDADMWAGQVNVFKDWYHTAAAGHTLTCVLNTVCVGDSYLSSLDWIIEQGGAL